MELEQFRVSRHCVPSPNYPTRVVLSLHDGGLRKGTPLNAIISGSGLTRDELLRRLWKSAA